MMAQYIALIRAINVGGKNQIRMAELRELLESFGWQDVVTYIQSGNVVFDTTATKSNLGPQIAKGLLQRFQIATSVFVYSCKEWKALVANNPLAAHADQPRNLHLMLLSDKTPPNSAELLEPLRQGQERFAIGDRAVYLYYPQGFARSKLSSHYIEKQLSLESTCRNWRTVNRIWQLCRQG